MIKSVIQVKKEPRILLFANLFISVQDAVSGHNNYSDMKPSDRICKTGKINVSLNIRA